jgi:hypothetical protein
MGRIIAGLAILLVGLGLLAGAAILVKNQREFRASALQAEGTVVDFATHRSDGKTMYTPVVQFTAADGRAIEISGSTSSSSPGYERGERVPVFYSANTPEQAQIDSFMENWFGALIISIFGVLGTSIGGALFAFGLRRRRVRRWLAQHGMKVRAKMLGAEENTSYKVNGRHPWRVRAQWQHPVTQKLYVFYSDNLWFDPSDYCTAEQIEALVNADDPRQYHLDTSFLPERA